MIILKLWEQITNRRFLILDSTQTTIAVYNCTALLRNVTMNNTIVVDYCLETNRDEFYTLQTTNVSGSPYKLGYYSLLYNWSRRIDIPENFDPTQKIVMKCFRSSIFLNFTNKIRVYTLNQSMWNIKTIRDHGSLYNMNVFGQMLTVRNDSHILLFNTSANYSLARTIQTDPLYTYFESIYFGSNTYLYIARKPIGSDITLISQYDLRINQTIFELKTNISGTAMGMVQNKIFQHYDSDIILAVRAWSPDNSYLPIGISTSCMAGYTYQSVVGVSGVTTFSCVQTNFNLLVMGGYQNSSTSISAVYPFNFMLYEGYNIYNDFNNYDGCNPGNTSNTINSTLLNDSAFPIAQPNVVDQKSQQNYMSKYNTSIVSLTCSIVSKAITLTQARRSLPQFFQTFAMFVEDLELYRYHQASYPLSFQFFIEKTSLMDQIDFNLTKQIVLFQRKNAQYMNLHKVYQKNVDKIYLLSSSKQNYFQGSLTIISIFISFKILQLMLFFLKSKIKILVCFYRLVKQGSRWWTLITALFQANMASMIFNCFLQLSIPSSLEFDNKINLMITFLIAFVFLQYTITFYPIVYALEQKKYSKMLLTRSKQKMNSYFLESFLFVSRSYLRGVLSGLLINSYNILIFCLFASDFVFLFASFKLRHYFINKYVKLFAILYFLSLTLLDLFYAIEIVSRQAVVDLNRESFALFIVLILLTATFGHVIHGVCQIIATMIKRIRNRPSRMQRSLQIQDNIDMKLNIKNKIIPLSYLKSGSGSTDTCDKNKHVLIIPKNNGIDKDLNANKTKIRFDQTLTRGNNTVLQQNGIKPDQPMRKKYKLQKNSGLFHKLQLKKYQSSH